MPSRWSIFPTISSSSTWSPMESACASMAHRSISIPGHWCGERWAPTVSTRTSSCCIKAPQWCRLTSSVLLANLLAQAEALAFGKTAEEVATDGVRSDLVPHRTFPGGRPSTVILAQSLTPAVLGQLIALYEHIVFVQGTIWQINSYDQWGVELGKVLATRIAPELAGAVEPGAHDSSTLALIARLRSMRSGE
jgi:hypothetical protein